MSDGFFPLGFLAAFAAMWCTVAFFLSRVSGWSKLAERYRAASAPQGERFLWNSAQVGAVSFRSCLNMTVSDAGFYMIPVLVFGLFMPGLLIPWSDVRFEGFRKILFFRFACFRLGGADGPVLSVWGRTGERLIPHLAEESRRAFADGRDYADTLFPRVFMIIALVGAAIGLLAAFFAGRR